MKFIDGGGSFEIILYLLLAIGGIAVNAYRNVNKKKEERERRAARTIDFPETAEETEFEKPSEPTIFYEEEIVPETVVTEEPKIDLPEAGTYVEGVTSFKETEDELFSGILEEPGDSLADELNIQESSIQSQPDWEAKLQEEKESNAFDLKKAIIYSEIIHAKYI